MESDGETAREDFTHCIIKKGKEEGDIKRNHRQQVFREKKEFIC